MLEVIGGIFIFSNNWYHSKYNIVCLHATQVRLQFLVVVKKEAILAVTEEILAEEIVLMVTLELLAEEEVILVVTKEILEYCMELIHTSIY